MSLSLCICTYRRAEELATCLASIADGGERPDQVIVSDDGHEVEAELVATAYPWVTYQRGPGRGLSANRNACIDAVTADHVAFIDDDVVVPSTFVPLARSITGRDVVTGHEVNHDPTPHKVTPHNADYLGFQRSEPRGQYRSIVINATVFPTELFDRARFDECLRYGSDEIDMARHLTSLGYTIRYLDELYVHHHPSPANRAEYEPLVPANRLYTTTKAHLRYDRRPLKAAGYFLLGSAHLLVSVLRGEGGDARSAAVAIRTAAGYLVRTA